MGLLTLCDGFGDGAGGPEGGPGRAVLDGRARREAALALALRPADVANAVGDESVSYLSLCDPGLRAVWPVGALVGAAVTVRTAPGDNFGPTAALMYAGPGDVVVVECAGDGVPAAQVGGLLGRVARDRGVVGFVVDGAVRDVADLEELGLPVFARTVTPRRATKAGPAALGGAVTVGGVVVRSGDLVVADRDGVAVVHAAGFDRVWPLLERAVADDRALEREPARAAARFAALTNGAQIRR